MPRGARYQAGTGYLSRLPSARKVSAAIVKSKNVSDATHSHAVMQFGQFLDHDFSSTAKSGEEHITKVMEPILLLNI